MTSADRFSQQERLLDDLNSLKQILACPRLYLAQHFSELTSQIDLAAVSLLATKPTKPDKKQQTEINRIQANWDSITAYVTNFQAECLREFSNADFDSATVNSTEAGIKEIQGKLSDLQALDAQITDESAESEVELFADRVEEIDTLIYENSHRLLRLLCRDRSVFFLNKELFEAYTDEKVFFGKLCHVTDSYFGHKGVANIRESNLGNDDLEMQKHTNEFLRTFYFTKQKRSFLSGSYFCEVTLNCENEICMNLYNKNLSFVDADIFRGFSSLTYIDMTCNNLARLPAGVFCGLVNLTVLNLGGELFE